MDPITYGVVMGLGESFLAGKRALSEAAKEKAEKEAEAQQNSMDTFVTFATNPDNRRIIRGLYDSGDKTFFSLLAQLPLHSSAAINMNALGSLSLTPIESEYLTAVNGNNGVEVARSLVIDRNVQNNLLGSPTGKGVWSLITSKAISGLSAGERDLFNGLSDDPQKKYKEAQALLASYPSDSVFGSILAQIKEPVSSGYEPLGTDFFNSIKSLLPSQSGKDDDETPVLAQGTLKALGAARKRILPYVEAPIINITPENPEGEPDPNFVPDPVAFKDLLGIDVLLGQYGTSNGLAADADAETISERLQRIVDSLPSSEIADKSARGSFAQMSLISLMGAASTDEGGLPTEAQKKFREMLEKTELNGAGTPGAFSAEDLDNFNIITSISEMANEIDKNRSIYGGGLAVDTQKSRQEDPAGWLFAIDAVIKKGQFDDMTAEEKQTFKSHLTEALIADADQRRNLKNAAGESTPAPARAYRQIFKNIYEAIPTEMDTILGNMGFTKINETASGAPNVPAAQVTAEGTPLPETQLKLETGQVININEHAVKFANSMGMTTHAMFKTDLHFGLLDFGSSDPARLYKAANSVKNSGIFANRTDQALSQDSAVKLAQIFAAQGVTDMADQIRVVSTVMSSDIPQKFQPATYDYAMSEQNFNAFMMQATGGQINLKDISKLRTNTNDFLSVATEVRGYLENLGEGSRFTDNLSAFILNLGGVRGNLVSQAFQGGSNLLQELGIFKEADIRAADGFTAAEQARMVQDVADEFFASEFLENNALLKQALVTLAYNYAKTMDPSGRISERDFQAALDAVAAGDLDVRETQIAVVENLISKARENLGFFDGVFAVGVESAAGGQTYRPTTATIQKARSMRYYRQIQQNTMGIEKVTMYTQDVANFGTGMGGAFPSKKMKDKYTFLPATGLGTQAVQDRIFRVQLKKRDGTSGDFIPGVPLYVDSNGVILTQARMQPYLMGAT